MQSQRDGMQRPNQIQAASKFKGLMCEAVGISEGKAAASPGVDETGAGYRAVHFQKIFN